MKFSIAKILKVSIPVDFVGVYVLFNNGECIYVGQSVNVAHRVSEHVGRFHFNNVELFKCDIDQLSDLEAEKIIEYKPVENKTLPKCNLYTNVTAFARRLDEFVRSEMTPNEIETTKNIKPKYIHSLSRKGMKGMFDRFIDSEFNTVD